MTEDFDKEIDSLLRQTVRRETFAAGAFEKHADADEISLYAENGLPPAVRVRVTEHLADCVRCRKILSEVIGLNSASISEQNIIATPEIIPVKSQIPWYKKLFAAPSLAYSLGGLVILLGGLIMFAALQNSKRSESISAKIEPIPMQTMSGPAADESYTANANTAVNLPLEEKSASNSALAKVSENAKPLPKIEQEAVQSSAAPDKTKTSAASGNSPEIAAAAPTRPAPVTAPAVTEDKTVSLPSAAVTAAEPYKENKEKEETRNRSQNYSNQSQAVNPNSENVRNRQIQNLPRVSRSNAPVSESADSSAGQAKKAELSDKKIIGGKTFTRNQRVWYDSAYNQQKTVNVRRASEEYKKLDANLRLIADSLGGTAVIVWSGKAYRIQ